MTTRVVLLGATGYTEALVLRALLGRGVKPVVAGRNRTAIAELARAAGGLDHAKADAGDRAAVASLLGRGDVLITTVGPFARYGYPSPARPPTPEPTTSTPPIATVDETRQRIRTTKRVLGWLKGVAVSTGNPTTQGRTANLR